MRFLVLPCDGIGPEITKATMQVLEAANSRFGLGITSDYEDVGFPSLEKYGTTLRDEVIDKARTYDGIVLGPQSHMDYPARDKGGVNVSGGFRVRLDLYANVRPARTRPYLPGKKMDLVIMLDRREATINEENCVGLDKGFRVLLDYFLQDWMPEPSTESLLEGDGPPNTTELSTLAAAD